MLHLLRSYFLFLIRSTNQHGVHSPFIYALVTKCFYDTKKYRAYSTLKKIRKALLKNKTFIEVTDFGAGSRIFKSNTRRISKIASTAGITSKRAKLLYRITHYFEPTNILEIGTSVGLATPSLALGSRNANITTLEGCPSTSKVAKESFDKFQLKNITVKTIQFDVFFETLLEKERFDLIYFDGNHSYEATMDYFNTLLPTATNDTVWIFDDIHWSKEMNKAWDAIISHPQITASIDTFQWGIVFFRKEQVKEHFTIRV